MRPFRWMSKTIRSFVCMIMWPRLAKQSFCRCCCLCGDHRREIDSSPRRITISGRTLQCSNWDWRCGGIKTRRGVVDYSCRCALAPSVFARLNSAHDPRQSFNNTDVSVSQSNSRRRRRNVSGRGSFPCRFDVGDEDIILLLQI